MNQERIKSSILEKIKHGDVAMRPRWHFVLKGMLLTSGVVLLTLGLLYLTSLIIFFFRQTGLFAAPFYGMRGVFTFLQATPWVLVMFTGAFVLVLEVLVRKYSFGYRTPLLYMLFVILGVSVLGTYVIAQTPMHVALDQFAREKQVPMIVSLYDTYGHRDIQNVHPCTIQEVRNDGFIVENLRGEVLLVKKTPETRQSTRFTPTVGMRVLVFGERAGDTITAFGIRELPTHMEEMMQAGGGSRMRMHMDMHPEPQVEGRWRSMK